MQGYCSIKALQYGSSMGLLLLMPASCSCHKHCLSASMTHSIQLILRTNYMLKFNGKQKSRTIYMRNIWIYIAFPFFALFVSFKELQQYRCVLLTRLRRHHVISSCLHEYPFMRRGPWIPSRYSARGLRLACPTSPLCSWSAIPV